MTYFPRTTSTRATLHPPGASAFSSTGLKSGYDKQEVDAFRSAVQDTFLGGAVFWVSTPPVRSDDLRSKQFSTHRPGYNKTQVAAFLEAAGLRLAAMESTDKPQRPLASDAILAAWTEWADSTRFSTRRLREGYDKREVDVFRSAVRDTFLGGRRPPLTWPAPPGKQFPTHRPGYDVEEVYAFLDQAELRLAAVRHTDEGAT
jgi:DivIVA domain-containing protein